jgi:hypothetical protein
MPNVGTRLPGPTSHTSTHQWQSFEIRMRYRRAERCVARAEAAFDAGMEEEARAALAEARALNPETPDFDSVRAAVLRRRAAVLAAQKQARLRRAAAIAGACVLFVAAAVAIWTTSGPAVSAPTVPLAAAAPAPSAPAVPAATVSPSTETAVPAVSGASDSSKAANDSVAPTSGETRLTSTETAKPPDPLPAAEPSVAASSAAPEPSLPAIEKSEPQLRLETPAPATTSASLPPSTSGADRLVSDLPTAVMRIPRPAPPPAAPPPPPDPRTLEEPRVRATLAQFEAAYNSLSAQAAQAVWPTVDERSLARAFDSLESQQVALGECSITINGTTAAADCAVTTSWTPKVGGGQRRESRRWRFDLAKANGAWVIENFQAR